VNRAQRRHPLTGRPIRPLAHRRDGRPIWPVLGGDDTITDESHQAILSLDDLRGKTLKQLEELVEVADAHARGLTMGDGGELRTLDEAEKTALKVLLDVREKARERINEHRQVEEVLARRPESVRVALKSLGTRRDSDPLADFRYLTSREAKDQALRSLDSKFDTAHMSAPQKDQVEREIRTSEYIARRVLVTENDAYREAFLKMVTKPDGHIYLSDEERHALRAYDEFRAMSENTTTAGGFGVPVFIDASIILTAQESPNPFLQMARQEQINTNIWKGVSSAGVSWTFQTEASTTSDASPALAQPSVTVHMARGFIPYSIEVDQDYPGFATEMGRLLGEGYDELLTNKFTVGSGTGEPKGILTALSATAADRVRIQTSGAGIGPADPYAVWKALPLKYQPRASWLMGVGVNNGFLQLGTANVYHASSTTLPDAWLDVLFGRPVYPGAYMPDLTTSTSLPEGFAVVGDFRNFLIARRGGMSIELVQTVVQQVTAGSGVAVPTGQRGWFGYARIGSDAVNTAGFRLLVNTG
jgi:HK97 family phage major capsid protein